MCSLKCLEYFVGTVSFFFADVDPDLFFCTDVLCLCCVVGSEPLISQCVSRRVSLHFKRSCCERLYYHSSLWAQQHDSCSVNLWPAQIALWIASSRPLSPHPYIPASFSSLCFRLSPVFCSFHEQMERMSTVFCRKQLFLTSQLSHYILRILLVQWSRVRFYCPTINKLQLNFFLVIDSQSGDGTQTSHTMMLLDCCWIQTFPYHLNCSTKLIMNTTNNE